MDKSLGFHETMGTKWQEFGLADVHCCQKEFNKDNNTVAMCGSGLYQIDRIRTENPAFYNSNEWMVVPWPVFKNAVRDVKCNYYGHYYMVNAESSKKNSSGHGGL